MPVRFCQMFSKLAVLDRSCFQTGICAGLIQSNRVEACKHSDIRQDRRIVLAMAVTVRADILYKRYMEARTAVTDCLCILSHFPVREARLHCYSDCIRRHSCRPLYNVHSPCIYHNQLRLFYLDRKLHRFRTLSAQRWRQPRQRSVIDRRLTTGMWKLLHLSGAASASHTDIFQCTAEARCFMAFEVA